MPSTTSLWREGFAACKRNTKALLPPVLAFSFLLVICNFYSLHDEVQMLQDRVQAVLNGEGMPTLQATAPVTRLAHLCASLMQLIAFYYFSVAYLRREPITETPEFGTSSFFTWLGQIALAALGILGLGLAVVLAGAAIGMVVSFVLNGSVAVVALLTSFGMMCVFIYGGVRFMLTGPLAISGIRNAAKASWRMSRRNVWRLLWGYLMLVSVIWFILFGIFLLPLAGLFVFTDARAESMPFILGLSVMMAFSSVATLASGSVYCCVANRILYDEQGLPAPGESG